MLAEPIRAQLGCARVDPRSSTDRVFEDVREIVLNIARRTAGLFLHLVGLLEQIGMPLRDLLPGLFATPDDAFKHVRLGFDLDLEPAGLEIVHVTQAFGLGVVEPEVPIFLPARDRDVVAGGLAGLVTSKERIGGERAVAHELGLEGLLPAIQDPAGEFHKCAAIVVAEDRRPRRPCGTRHAPTRSFRWWPCRTNRVVSTEPAGGRPAATTVTAIHVWR